MFELFEPFKIRNVEFGNRVVRSSIGGRMAYYDGRVSPAWVAFEKRFATGGVAAIISATISVNKDRMSPLEYPSIHSDRFVGPLRDAVREVKKAGTGKVACRRLVPSSSTWPRHGSAAACSAWGGALRQRPMPTSLPRSSGRSASP
jgi:2,4-dienoyl-CoA reductase-like NADH-dependent reductase (Old Yellow Enzyme family)